MFGSKKRFFDKEATIKEYFSIVPPEERKHFETYEELYQEALRYVEPQNFNENTKDQEDFFQLLTADQKTIGVLLGAIAFAVSREVDTHGTELEKAIDKILPSGYDTNNPFDVKEGLGHRIFGHDPATYGLKNIPGDTNIKVKDLVTGERKIIKIAEFLGSDINSNVSMLDLIWKYYGNNDNKLSGIINCLKHTIVHFSKDLLTPAGVPLPFTTLFEEYHYYENLNAHGIMYKDSLMQKLDNIGLNLKASDFAAYFVIKSFISIYCKKNKMDNSAKDDLELISMGTCISMQTAALVFGQQLQVGKRGIPKKVPGGKINPILSIGFAKVAIKEMYSVCKERRRVNKEYEKKYKVVK